MAELLEMPLRTYQRLEAGTNIPEQATIDLITSKLVIDEVNLVQVPDSETTPEDRFYTAQAALAKAGMRPLTVEQLKRFMSWQDDLVPAADLRALQEMAGRNSAPALPAAVRDEWLALGAALDNEKIRLVINYGKSLANGKNVTTLNAPLESNHPPKRRG